MKERNIRFAGTTLVEVTVASFLLFTISGTIALALATVFDGYMITVQGGSVEQDAQLMLSRVRFASEKHDDAVILSHAKRDDYSEQGAIFSGTTLSSTTKNNLGLQDNVLQGTYTSSTQTLSERQKIGKLMIVGNSSTTSATLKLQLAAFSKIDGICSIENMDFVGPDKTPGTYYENLLSEVPESASGVFLNPADCVRYKIYLERSSESIDTPRIFEVRLEK